MKLPTLGVTKFTKSNFDIQQLNLCQIIEQKLALSSNFRCDQIYKYLLYKLGHTLCCYLSKTKILNKTTSVKWLRLAPTFGVIKLKNTSYIDFGHTLLM